MTILAFFIKASDTLNFVFMNVVILVISMFVSFISPSLSELHKCLQTISIKVSLANKKMIPWGSIRNLMRGRWEKESTFKQGSLESDGQKNEQRNNEINNHYYLTSLNEKSLYLYI